MIIVMGLPGAGKSTVLQVASDAGWKVLNYGTLMFEIASKEYGIADRDMLRKLPSQKQKKVQEKVGKMLSAEKERKVILDTHCSINTPKGYLPGLPFLLLKDLPVERLVLLTAPVAHILARRKKDASRVRDEQGADSLKEHDEMNHYYLATYSVVSGAPAVILQNADGKLEEVKSKFASYLE
ncbi:MAG: adenylate kinase [Candidatus Micrarchaeia archaeon]